MTVLRIAPSPRTRWRGPRTRQNERGCMSADLWRCPGTAVPQTNNPSGGMLRSISYSMQPRGAKDEEGRSGTRARGNASAHGCLLCLHRALHTPCRLRVVGAVGAVGADELIELSEREQRARARARERASERASERDFIRKPCPADWDCSQLITYLLHTPAVPSAAAGPRYLSLTRETDLHSVCSLPNKLSPFLSLLFLSFSLSLLCLSPLSLSLLSLSLSLTLFLSLSLLGPCAQRQCYARACGAHRPTTRGRVVPTDRHSFRENPGSSHGAPGTLLNQCRLHKTKKHTRSWN